MKERKPYRFIISGGGTGGHIYPAIAVANEIRSRFSDAEILFVGAKGRMEMTKVKEAGYDILGLWISGFQRRVTIENLYFPVKVIMSIISAKKVIKNFKPDVALGFGGYASGPVMLAATGRRIPSLIQEQNSYAGLTNKSLGRRVNRICVAYENMDVYFPKSKIRLTGNPVRKEIMYASQKRSEAFEHFGLDKDKKVLLVIGGSLGARTINNCIIAGLDKLIGANMQIVWQTGKFYHADMMSKAGEKEGLKVLEFIKEMDLAYAAADLVISRAGALSVSELCLAGKPVVFVPSPNVAEDHQTKNANALASKHAALVVRDRDAPALLIDTVIELMNDESKQQGLSGNIRQMGRPNATKDIVDEVIELVN